MTSVIRSADITLLVVDLVTPGLLDDVEFVKAKLREHKVALVRKGEARLGRTAMRGSRP